MTKLKEKEGGLFRTCTIGFTSLTKYWFTDSTYSFYYRCRHKRVQFSKIIIVIYISQTLMHTELTCIRVESGARKCQPRGKRNR